MRMIAPRCTTECLVIGALKNYKTETPGGVLEKLVNRPILPL